MWSVTNYFLLNLTLSDILMATLNTTFSFIYMRDRVWHFGAFYCSMSQFISLSTVPVSVFTMLAITLDRRRAIITPLAPKTTRLVVMVVLVVIWIISTTVALPPTLNSTTFTINSSR